MELLLVQLMKKAQDHFIALVQ